MAASEGEAYKAEDKGAVAASSRGGVHDARNVRGERDRPKA
jgi:hypothetical protein